MNQRQPLDPLDVLRSARESVRKLQELASKLTVPVEQRKAFADSISKMVMPGEQLQAMIDLADAFGPAYNQIVEIRDTIADQRAQLEVMLDDLERIDAKVARLAVATEQISAMQEPFRILLRRFEHHDDDTDAASFDDDEPEEPPRASTDDTEADSTDAGTTAPDDDASEAAE